VAEPWHPYVFDSEGRRFVGDFEGMYRAEVEGDFDSWHQSDPRRLDTKVATMLLEEITYTSAIDLGCGKGGFTAQLKKRDNRVVGVDASETAIRIARGPRDALPAARPLPTAGPHWLCQDARGAER
jgi:SAM-dependent methyltransferase